MSRIVRALGMIAVVSLLAACQSMPTQGYNKSASNIHSVGIAPLGIPAQPVVQILAPVGANFGLIGGLIEAGRAADASKELQDIFGKTGYDYRKDVADSLSMSLAAASLPVSSIAGERPAKEQFKFLGTCPSAPGADACLDVFVTFFGYMAAGATTDYVPTVKLTARMVRNSDSKLLFQDQVEYNSLAGSKAIVVQPSDKYRFKDRDAMKADPQRVTAGMQEAVRAAMDELAKQFM